MASNRRATDRCELCNITQRQGAGVKNDDCLKLAHTQTAVLGGVDENHRVEKGSGPDCGNISAGLVKENNGPHIDPVFTKIVPDDEVRSPFPRQDGGEAPRAVADGVAVVIAILQRTSDGADLRQLSDCWHDLKPRCCPSLRGPHHTNGTTCNGKRAFAAFFGSFAVAMITALMHDTLRTRTFETNCESSLVLDGFPRDAHVLLQHNMGGGRGGGEANSSEWCDA